MYPLQIGITDDIKKTFVVGEAYGGGFIIYVDGTGQHGIICADQDISTTAPWGCSGTNIAGTSPSLGTGQANTNLILAGCATAGIAARLCDQSTLNGYNDWYLPSTDELLRAITVNVITDPFGRWSSVQPANNTQAMAVAKGFVPFSTAKTSTDVYTRPFRSF